VANIALLHGGSLIQDGTGLKWQRDNVLSEFFPEWFAGCNFTGNGDFEISFDSLWEDYVLPSVERARILKIHLEEASPSGRNDKRETKTEKDEEDDY